MNKHKDFILSPVTHILHEVVSATYAIGNGMETYPLSEHIFQSAFLRMTGSQEQKMKCICWEMATDDYVYRYDRYTLNRLGECSSYKEKMEVYSDLIKRIKNLKPDFDVSTAFEKRTIRRGTVDELKAIFSNSSLSVWTQNSFLDFTTNHGDLIKNEQFANENNLLESNLQDKYTLLYKHRNRCAHNTLSYQQNLPTLAELLDENYRYDTYVMRFALLILIDKIFIALYQKYLMVIDEH